MREKMKTIKGFPTMKLTAIIKKQISLEGYYFPLIITGCRSYQKNIEYIDVPNWDLFQDVSPFVEYFYCGLVGVNCVLCPI